MFNRASSKPQPWGDRIRRVVNLLAKDRLNPLDAHVEFEGVVRLGTP